MVIDIEMVDTWGKNYLSTFTFEPLSGGAAESVVERYGGNSLPRVVRGDRTTMLAFEQLNLEDLVILAGERILLRFPQSRHGSERLIVRTGSGDWRIFDFDDDSLEAFPAWQADLGLSDVQHGGFSELVGVDIADLTFTFYRHGGYVVRELQFRLTADGRALELVGVERAPLEVRNRGRFEPEWASASLLGEVENLFYKEPSIPLQGNRQPVIDDVRIVSFYACPPSASPDRLDVLFGLRASDDTDLSNYRTELWRLRRIDGQWQREGEAHINLHSAGILDLQNANYDEVRECMKVY